MFPVFRLFVFYSHVQNLFIKVIQQNTQLSPHSKPLITLYHNLINVQIHVHVIYMNLQADTSNINFTINNNNTITLDDTLSCELIVG